MNVTFVIPHDSFAGGVRVVAVYAQRLQQRGHCVTVVSAPLPRPKLRQRLKAFLQPQSVPPKAEGSYFDSIGVDCRCLDRYRPLRDSDLPDADVVVATWWETAEWIAPLSAAKGAKVYFIQHHEVFEYLPKRRVEATYRLPFYRIAVAQWLVDILRDRYQAQQVALVPNGVDLTRFYSSPRSKAPVPTVGVVYTATPWKGIDIALQAFQRALQDLPQLRLVAFGTEQIAAELPLPENAQYFFRPAQEQLKHIYAQCDAWLFSSRTEGFGLPILEAMACRTPVIAAPTGAAPELLSNGGGLLLDGNDPALMAEAIRRICTLDVKEWQQLSEKAYQTASQQSWENATRDFETALKDAIAQPRQDDSRSKTDRLLP
ncbi:glycosyltransferase family 4 protein [Altericista sp. CCNU0014]|uniref:glycosyltransferase family 4 protein n=1 Tax=Altericista sp. CCNU0014 TaxID=3082949 RepID=UPI00384EB5F9